MIGPNETLILIRAAQFEIVIRRAMMSIPNINPSERKALANRIDELVSVMRLNGFNDMS